MMMGLFSSNARAKTPANSTEYAAVLSGESEEPAFGSRESFIIMNIDHAVPKEIVASAARSGKRVRQKRRE